MESFDYLENFNVSVPLIQSFNQSYCMASSMHAYFRHEFQSISNACDVDFLLDTMHSVESAKELSKKRVSHALNRIKAKGYYAENMNEIRNKIINKQVPFSTFPLLDLIVFTLYPDADQSHMISEYAWQAAIEYTMFLRHPEVKKDVNIMFGRFIDEDIGYVYSYLFLFACIEAINEDNQNLLDEIIEFQMDLSDSAETMSIEPPAGTAEDSVMEKDSADLRKRIAELEAMLSAENKAHSKDILRLEHQLKDTAAEAEERIRILAQENTYLIDYLTDSTSLDDVEELEIKEEAPLVLHKTYTSPLPNSRVLFFGGHQNFTKKVKVLHPDWTYLSDNKFKTRGAVNFEVIFYPAAQSTTSERPQSSGVDECALGFYLSDSFWFWMYRCTACVDRSLTVATK